MGPLYGLDNLLNDAESLALLQRLLDAENSYILRVGDRALPPGASPLCPFATPRYIAKWAINSSSGALKMSLWRMEILRIDPGGRAEFSIKTETE
jgi:hypothetical protein